MADRTMSFLGHLGELRTRLIYAVWAWLVGSIIGFTFFQPIFRIIKRPLTMIDPPLRLNSFDVLGPFMLKIKVAAFAGFIIGFPIISYQILAFVTPALKSKERKFLFPLLFALMFFFMSGVVVCYWFILPASAKWLVSQGYGVVDMVLNVDSYISFATLFMIAFGVGFETPVVVILLVLLGVLSPQQLRARWREAYVGIFVIAAIATPDWSIPPMVILAVSMCFLYEMAILVARIIVRRRKRRERRLALEEQ